MSGPSGGRTAAARTASPPKRRPQAKRTAQRPAVVSGLVAFARALPDHRVIDRLIRGRAWIPVLGVMLAGIVAMQVEVLKLGATMGRAIEQGSALQSRNELLRDSVASLQDEQRIERLASGLGMVMPAPGDVGFLHASNANLTRAAANIKAPDATAFSSLLTSNGLITQTPTPPTPSTSSSAPTTSVSSASTTVTPTAGTATPTSSSTASSGVAAASSGGTPGATTQSSATPVAPTTTTGTNSSGGASLIGG